MAQQGHVIAFNEFLKAGYWETFGLLNLGRNGQTLPFWVLSLFTGSQQNLLGKTFFAWDCFKKHREMFIRTGSSLLSDHFFSFCVYIFYFVYFYIHHTKTKNRIGNFWSDERVLCIVTVKSIWKTFFEKIQCACFFCFIYMVQMDYECKRDYAWSRPMFASKS